jgi:phenylacetic acid degradation operon negative regulatory protein
MGVGHQASTLVGMASTTMRATARGHRTAGDVARDDGQLLETDRLPRAQVGTTPQHLLMTLLGHYWFGRSEQLPSAALAELLSEFGISEKSGRTALNRLAKRGLLVSSKRGRSTYYGLSARALPLVREEMKRVVTFGARESRPPWDGGWTMVSFSVPESRRDVRHAVRTNLGWLGFAALYDGLWCLPWDERDAALTMLSDLGVHSATVMRAEVDPRSTVQPLSAWDLDAVRQRYLEFEEEFSPILDDVRRGALTASQALVGRTKVMDTWRTFPSIEPDLPTDLLPGDWPRERMRKLFLEVYDSLAPVARARFEQIVAKYSPELASLVTHPPLELEPTA